MKNKIISSAVLLGLFVGNVFAGIHYPIKKHVRHTHAKHVKKVHRKVLGK